MADIKVKVTRNLISAKGNFSAGQIVTVDEKTARHWLESNAAEIVKPQPEQNKMVGGPAQNKGAPAGNSFGAPAGGRSTDLPSSSAPGGDLLSSASQGATSTPSKSPRSRRGGQQEPGGESS